MAPVLQLTGQAVTIGVGATGFLDLWSLYQARICGARTPDYGQVGRLLGQIVHGRLTLAGAGPMRGEKALGWFVHYATGVAFAFGFRLLAGADWVRSPTFGLALAFGLATVVFPFAVLQPAIGAGFAARKTLDPTAARLRSLGNHAVFGVGLYAAAWILARVIATA